MLLQPLMTASASNRQNIDDKARFLFFYHPISMQPPPSQCPHSRLWIFGSFGSIESGRTSFFSTRVLLKTQVLADGTIWCFFVFSKVLFISFRRIYTHCTTVYLLGPNLHNTATQTYYMSAHVYGNSPMDLAQGWISQTTWLCVPAADIKFILQLHFRRLRLRVTEDLDTHKAKTTCTITKEKA